MRTFLLSLVAALVVCSTVSVAQLSCEHIDVFQTKCNSRYRGGAGEFDYYVLAQSWPASFCSDKFTNVEWPDCARMPAGLRDTLTLHGLWPQKYVGPYPSCCRNSPDGFAIDLDLVQRRLGDLQAAWPNSRDSDPTDSCRNLTLSIWQHEWARHGTCSGLTQEGYLDATLQVAREVGTPEFLRDNIGREVSRDELTEAFAFEGAPPGRSQVWATPQCRQGWLAEVFTCWDKDLNRIMCPAALGGGRRCPRRNVYIPRFGDLPDGSSADFPFARDRLRRSAARRDRMSNAGDRCTGLRWLAGLC